MWIVCIREWGWANEKLLESLARCPRDFAGEDRFVLFVLQRREKAGTLTSLQKARELL